MFSVGVILTERSDEGSRAGLFSGLPLLDGMRLGEMFRFTQHDIHSACTTLSATQGKANTQINLLGLHYFNLLRSLKLGGGSEKCKLICFFAHLALILSPLIYTNRYR